METSNIYVKTKDGTLKIPVKHLTTLVNQPPEGKQWTYPEFCELIKRVPSTEIVNHLVLNLKIDPKIFLLPETGETENGTTGQESNESEEFTFTKEGTLKNISKFNQETVTRALKLFYNLPYSFSKLDHARAQLQKLEKDRVENLRTKHTRNISPSFKITSNMGDKTIVRPLKVELPNFDGSSTDAEEYIHKIETYGKLGSWTEEQMKNALIIGLKGDADLWYRNNEKEISKKSWTDLKAEFTDNFKKTQIANEWIIFQSRQQSYTEKAQNYVENKIFLARNLQPPLSEEVLIHWILMGMLPHIAQILYRKKSATIKELKNNLAEVMKSFEVGRQPNSHSSTQKVSIDEKQIEDNKLEKLEQMVQQLVLDNKSKGKEREGKRDHSYSRSPSREGRDYSRSRDRYNGPRRQDYNRSYDRSQNRYRDYNRNYNGNPQQSSYSRPYYPRSRRGRFENNNGRYFSRKNQSYNSVRCHFCDKMGHFSDTCFSKKRFLDNEKKKKPGNQ